MRHIKKIFAIAGIAMATFISQSALANTCKVTYPTDTPLNARQTPNGKIIGSVKIIPSSLYWHMIMTTKVVLGR